MGIREDAAFARRRNYRKRLIVQSLIAIAVVGVVLGIGIAAYSAWVGTERDVVIKVEDKERVCDSGKSCKYLVFTNHGTFKITDSLLSVRFDSSDVYGRIRRGHTYEAHVRGVRIEFLSEYPNIITIKEAAKAGKGKTK